MTIEPGGHRRRRPDPDGTLEVFVSDEQHVEPVDVERWATLARNVLTDRGVSGAAELSVLFVDDEAITDLNKRFLDVDGPTDVLAFPIDDDLSAHGRFPETSSTGPGRRSRPADEAPVLLGDVIICPMVAVANAPAHAGTGHDGSVEDEVALLVVHGILHVLGMDHAAPEDEATMKAAERDLLDRFHHRRPTERQ